MRRVFIPTAITLALVFATLAMFPDRGGKPIDNPVPVKEGSAVVEETPTENNDLFQPPKALATTNEDTTGKEKAIMAEDKTVMAEDKAIMAEDKTVMAEDRTLLRNASFEEGQLDFPYYWKREVENWWRVELIWDKNQSHTGKASICISNRNWLDSGTESWCQDIWDVPSGNHLILHGFIKTEELWGKAQICIQCLDSQGRVIASSTTYHASSGNRDWTEVGTDIVVPPETSHMKVICSLRGRGKVWFDDINLLVNGTGTYSKDQ